MENKKKITDEPKNKNVGESITDGEVRRRYERFENLSRCLRGTGGRQIFPIFGGSGTYPKEITNQVSDAQRIYTTSCAKTLKGNGGGQGAKTGLYLIPENSYCIDANYYKGTTVKDYLEKKRRQLIIDKRGNSSWTVRRLTPRECNYLQGFPKDWDRWGIKFINLETFNKENGKKTKTNPFEILQTLQKTIGKGEGEGRRITELITLLQKEVLQPRMYAREFQRKVEGECIRTTRELSCKTIDYCDELLNLWESEQFRYSSQGQKQVKQLIKKFTSSLQKLSYEVTSEGGWLEQSQGFEQGERFFGKIHLMSDSARYKMMGNAVTTNVIEAIFTKIFEVDQ